MKHAVIMTQEEYEHLMRRINELEHDCEALSWHWEEEEERANKLWNILNRPAIEAAEKKHDDEFYAWCADKAAEYEEKDFDEWVISRAKFYNNGIAKLCSEMNISEKDVYEDRKYNFGIEYWRDAMNKIDLMRLCNDKELEALKSEGWSDFWADHYHTSTILWWVAQEYWHTGDLYHWKLYTDLYEEAKRMGYEYA